MDKKFYLFNNAFLTLFLEKVMLIITFLKKLTMYPVIRP